MWFLVNYKVISFLSSRLRVHEQRLAVDTINTRTRGFLGRAGAEGRCRPLCVPSRSGASPPCSKGGCLSRSRRLRVLPSTWVPAPEWHQPDVGFWSRMGGGRMNAPFCSPSLFWASPLGIASGARLLQERRLAHNHFEGDVSQGLIRRPPDPWTLTQIY